MKKFFYLLTLGLSFLLTSSLQEAEATHLVGSDIIYRCKGNGKYEITVRVYRDCNGIQLSQSPIVMKCSTTTINVTAQTKISVRDVTGIDPRCPVQSRCSGTFPYGIEEHVWVATVDLSSYNCCEWTISWAQSARGSNISTGMANQNFYTFAQMNKCVTPCNSSPDFTNPPVAIVCQGQDFVFNNGALDTLDSGDSLSYSLAPALINPGVQASYTGQWSPTRPLTFFGFPNTNLPLPAGFHLDPVTGDLAFRPTVINQVAVIVIEVKEWRMVNGVMTVVGITRRDMQVIVISCPNNNVPRIDPPYSKQACANQQVCIPIVTDDDDNQDTVRISWNRGIPGATFTHNNGTVKHASGEVCWTPTDAHVSNIPYTFTVKAEDDACTLPGRAIRAFSIFVRETPKATRDINLLTCGNVSLNYTPEKQYAGLSSNWVILDSNNRGVFSSNLQADTAFLQPGVHRVYLTLQTSTPCINIFIDSITVPDFVRVKLPNDTFVCAGTSLNINSVTSTGVSPFQYEWAQVLDDSVSGVLSTNTSYSVSPDSNVSYLIRVLDANQCSNYDTINVHYQSLPDVDLGPNQRICEGDIVTLNGGTDSMYHFLWSTGDTTAQIEVKLQGDKWVKVTDSLGCYNTDTMTLDVNKVQLSAGGNQFICKNDTAFFTATGADSYRWFNLAGFDPANPGTPLSTSASFSKVITGDIGFVFEGTKTENGITCIVYDSVKVIMRDLPQIYLAAQGPYCHNDPAITLMLSVQYPTLTTGTWRSDIEPDIVYSNTFYPDSVDAPNSIIGHEVIYRVVDNFGCANEEKTRIKVNPLPNVVLTPSVAFCGDVDPIALNTLKSAPVSTVGNYPKWYSATNNPAVDAAITGVNEHNKYFNISSLPQGQTYDLVFEYRSSLSGCTNYDTTSIRIKEVPNVDAGNLMPVCFGPDLVQLSDANATPTGGQWSSTDITLLSGNTAFQPSSIGDSYKYVAPGKSVRIYYTVEKEQCFNKDSLDVLIKNLPELTMTPVAGWCESAGPMDLTPLCTPTGGTWDGNGVSGNSFDPSIAGLGSTHTLKYTYTNPVNQCSSEDQFDIFAQASPEIEMVTSDKACVGQPYQVELKLTNATSSILNRTGDGEFESQGSGMSSSTLQKTTYYPGTLDNQNLKFTIEAVTTNNGYCPEDKVTKDIEIFPLPTASITPDKIKGCETLTVTFDAITDAAPGADITWDFGDGDIRTGKDNLKQLTKDYTKYGTYTVSLNVKSIASEGACTMDASTVTIEVLPTPVAEFSANRFETTVSLPGIQFYDQSTIEGGASISDWSWNFGDKYNSTSKAQNPFFSYPIESATDTGTYTVRLEIIADNGCEAFVEHDVHIRPEITVFIPNAFTPNGFGDSMNNRFYVVASEFKTFNIEIFTRWGEKVYESADISEGWDGKYKGVEAQQDVYVYVVRVTSIEGKEYEFHGTITLLR